MVVWKRWVSSDGGLEKVGRDGGLEKVGGW